MVKFNIPNRIGHIELLTFHFGHLFITNCLLFLYFCKSVIHYPYES